MVVNKDVEFLDLSGQGRQCSKPVNYPDNVDGSQVGTYFDGSPIVCGGYDGGSVGEDRDLCYRYDNEVSVTYTLVNPKNGRTFS